MITHNPKQRRQNRVRSKLALNLGVPRLTVFRSNQHLWAQIIDDKHGRTLVSASTKSLKLNKGTKTEKAIAVGEQIATMALEKNISKVRFDRGLYRYHGRVKALADGARSKGLNF
ncbi:MAG: 50S ribosomal protein L18 [Candidatus Shapirobacteria bacterium]|nr:50S ribosomal protein L18 [Candidatus Shapirobacteria bacterium]